MSLPMTAQMSVAAVLWLMQNALEQMQAKSKAPGRSEHRDQQARQQRTAANRRVINCGKAEQRRPGDIHKTRIAGAPLPPPDAAHDQC